MKHCLELARENIGMLVMFRLPELECSFTNKGVRLHVTNHHQPAVGTFEEFSNAHGLNIAIHLPSPHTSWVRVLRRDRTRVRSVTAVAATAEAAANMMAEFEEMVLDDLAAELKPEGE